MGDIDFRKHVNGSQGGIGADAFRFSDFVEEWGPYGRERRSAGVGVDCVPRSQRRIWYARPRCDLPTLSRAMGGCGAELRSDPTDPGRGAIGGVGIARKRGRDPFIAQIDLYKWLSFRMLRRNCTTPGHPRGWSYFLWMVLFPSKSPTRTRLLRALFSRCSGLSPA